ncbi:hypothetical protein QBC39DRAFT_337607 [Podospora conica]|nr:hypothetical protein QBC39DRAFT_337607 [Schizothecium conicum]
MASFVGRLEKLTSKPGLMATPNDRHSLELPRSRLEKSPSPNPRFFRQRRTAAEIRGILQTLRGMQTQLRARARSSTPHGPQGEGQWDQGQSQTPSGACSRIQDSGRGLASGTSRRRCDPVTGPNHGHPRFWHRGAWGSRIAPSPSPSTLSSMLITAHRARIRIGRLNEDSRARIRLIRRVTCPRGSRTYSTCLSGRTLTQVFRCACCFRYSGETGRRATGLRSACEVASFHMCGQSRE